MTVSPPMTMRAPPGDSDFETESMSEISGNLTAEAFSEEAAYTVPGWLERVS